MVSFNLDLTLFRHGDDSRRGSVSCFTAIAWSVLIHLGFLIALSLSHQSKSKTTWGSVLGASRPGLEVYLLQTSRDGMLEKDTPSMMAVSAKDQTTTQAPLLKEQTVQTPQKSAGSEEVRGIQYTGVNGVLQPLPHIATSSARQSGFLGLPLPSGDVQGVVSVEMEWAMRRQAALSMIGTQTQFMRQAFPSYPEVRCVVGLEHTSCHPEGQGLAEMLSALYLEAHRMDPSLPPMVWENQGHGAWVYALSP
jgi:hypothetical protein